MRWRGGKGTALGRGGWYYSFNAGGTDGSTIGWNVLALLDAAAGGITVPAFVKTEFVNYAIPLGLNMHTAGPNTIDGTFDYSADNQPNSGNGGTGGPNMAKNGIGLQAMFYADMVGLGNARVTRARNADQRPLEQTAPSPATRMRVATGPATTVAATRCSTCSRR